MSDGLSEEDSNAFDSAVSIEFVVYSKEMWILQGYIVWKSEILFLPYMRQGEGGRVIVVGSLSSSSSTFLTVVTVFPCYLLLFYVRPQ